MTPSEYRATLAVVGLTASVVQELFDIDELTSRRWATGDLPVPRAVTLSLLLMASYGVSIGEARILTGSIALLKSAWAPSPTACKWGHVKAVPSFCRIVLVDNAVSSDVANAWPPCGGLAAREPSLDRKERGFQQRPCIDQYRFKQVWGPKDIACLKRRREAIWGLGFPSCASQPLSDQDNLEIAAMGDAR